MWSCLLPCASQEILVQDDDELKKNFLAEAWNGHSVQERASEMQQKNIKNFVKNYVMENIVNCLTQGIISSLICYWSTK
jgi:phage pi2 protein 07